MKSILALILSIVLVAFTAQVIAGEWGILAFVLGYDERPRNIDPDNIWYRKYTRE